MGFLPAARDDGGGLAAAGGGGRAAGIRFVAETGRPPFVTAPPSPSDSGRSPAASPADARSSPFFFFFFLIKPK